MPCCAVLQGVPAIALSLADHKATQAQHYAAPSEVAVTLIEVRGPCSLLLILVSFCLLLLGWC